MTKSFQRLFNVAIDRWHIPYPHLYVDGKRGDRTDAAIVFAKRMLGYSGGPAKRKTITPVLLAQLRSPENRAWSTKRQRARALAARNAARSNTIQSLAARILVHRNITFSTWLSTGPERQRFVELAARGEAFCPHTQAWTTVDKRILEAMLYAADLGLHVEVNALTGGVHITQNHYHGTRIDLRNQGEPFASEQPRMIAAFAHFGFTKNSESNHGHYDPPGG